MLRIWPILRPWSSRWEMSVSRLPSRLPGPGLGGDVQADLAGVHLQPEDVQVDLPDVQVQDRGCRRRRRCCPGSAGPAGLWCAGVVTLATSCSTSPVTPVMLTAADEGAAQQRRGHGRHVAGFHALEPGAEVPGGRRFRERAGRVVRKPKRFVIAGNSFQLFLGPGVPTKRSSAGRATPGQLFEAAIWQNGHRADVRASGCGVGVGAMWRDDLSPSGPTCGRR